MILNRDALTDKRLALRRFTVGGFRPGAATAEYLRAQNTSRTQWRGRWIGPQVLRHCLQLGTLSLTSVRLPPRCTLEGSRFQAVIREFVLLQARYQEYWGLAGLPTLPSPRLRWRCMEVLGMRALRV